MLKKIGCEVVTANDGQAALDIWQREPFDLILMDCMMPVLDGYEATRQIRALERERGGHVPIIALTASVLEADRERCSEAGMDDFLSKPIARTMLEAALTRWLPTADRSASQTAKDGEGSSSHHES